MSFTSHAKEVIQRKLDRDKVKQRPGRGGKTFDYLPTEYVISLLNEAFDYRWSSRILQHTQVENEVIVQVELSVWDDKDTIIVKQHFGSAEMGGRGLTAGDAFKAATSDALKKAATLVGLGLELYQEDEPATKGPGFQPPKVPVPAAQSSTPAPPRPVVPAPPVMPPPPRAPVAAPSGVSTGQVPVPQPPVASPTSVDKNPFRKKSVGSGNTEPNATQINALTNLASRKNLSQSELIAKATVTDAMGSPVQTFEELTYDQAIQVIKAAQS